MSTNDLMLHTVNVFLTNGQQCSWLVDKKEVNQIQQYLRECSHIATIHEIQLGFFSFRARFDRRVYINNFCIEYVMLMEDLALGNSTSHFDNFNVLEDPESDAFDLPDAIFKFQGKSEALAITEVAKGIFPHDVAYIQDRQMNLFNVELEDDDGDMLYIRMRHIECMEITEEAIEPMEDDD